MTALLVATLLAFPSGTDDRARVVIVVGAPGSPEYASRFREWAGRWQAAAAKASAEVVSIGLGEEKDRSDRELVRAALTESATPGGQPLWLVLIGHGTFDGREAKFNLRGPDVTDRELAEWLAPVKRPTAVLDCTAASGPFLSRLSGPDRVVVTATKSGHEQNYARFGEYLSESIADPRADLDKDGQVSLLEAFLTAAGRVNEYYRTHAQLATEHALLDDNGDRLGTPPDWFRGVRATRRAKDGAPLDGPRAHQLHLVPGARELALSPDARRRRDELELAVAKLRDEKDHLAEVDYYRRLEPLLVELARIYRDTEADPRTGSKHEH